MKHAEGLPAESLIKSCKTISAECELPKRIISDAGINFLSEKFKDFCKKLNLEQVVLLTYQHQSNDQVEVCIKFIKCTMKNALILMLMVNLALLQIRSRPVGPGLQTPAILQFNRSIRSTMLLVNRTPITYDNNDNYCQALKNIKKKLCNS